MENTFSIFKNAAVMVGSQWLLDELRSKGPSTLVGVGVGSMASGVAFGTIQGVTAYCGGVAATEVVAAALCTPAGPLIAVGLGIFFAGLLLMHFADTPEKSQLEKVTQKHNHLILFINGLIQRKCVTDSELTEMLKLTTKPGEAPSSVYTRVCAANRTGFRCTECGNKFEPFQHHSGKSELCMVEECATTPVHCFIACCGKARAMSKKLQVKGGGSGSHHCGGGGLSDPE